MNSHSTRRSRSRIALLTMGLLAGSVVAVASPTLSSAQTVGAPVIPRQQASAGAPTFVPAPPTGDAAKPSSPAQSQEVRTRPTISEAALAEAKAASAKAPSQAKPAAPAGSSAPLTQTGPNFVGDSFGGPGGGLAPPDVHGAVGNQQFVEVTNSDITAWSLVPAVPTMLFNSSLNSFLSAVGDPGMFDPRVVYHPIYNRWIVIAPEFPNGANTVQTFKIGVSKTPDITAGMYIYSINTMDVTFPGSFFDYPQVGFDHDSIIITANIFNPFSGAHAQFWPLAELTSGLPLTYFYYNGLAATLAPPLVYDRNQKAYLVAAQSPNLKMYAASETSRDPVILTGPTDVAVTAWSVPPDAPQNGTVDLLDTIDGRFQNASTQIGNFLYQVHSITAFVSFATVQWYKINTATSAIVKQCLTFASGTSHDFNPSITANASGDVFLNWSVSKFVPSAAGTADEFVLARAGGIENTDATAACPAPTQLTYGSGQESGNTTAGTQVMRWGDYSSVYLKFNTDRALAANQLTQTDGGTGVNTGGPFNWATRIAELRFS